MTFKGRPIEQWPLEKSGASYSDQFEWRLAAQDSHYRYADFEQLDGDEQSRIVAFYRQRRRMEAVMADDQARTARRNRGRAGK